MTALGAAVAVLAVGALLLLACSDGDDQADEGSSDLIGARKAPGSNVTWNATDDVITTTFGGGIEMTYAATDTIIEFGIGPAGSPIPSARSVSTTERSTTTC